MTKCLPIMLLLRHEEHNSRSSAPDKFSFFFHVIKAWIGTRNSELWSFFLTCRGRSKSHFEEIQSHFCGDPFLFNPCLTAVTEDRGSSPEGVFFRWFEYPQWLKLMAGDQDCSSLWPTAVVLKEGIALVTPITVIFRCGSHKCHAGATLAKTL